MARTKNILRSVQTNNVKEEKVTEDTYNKFKDVADKWEQEKHKHENQMTCVPK